MLNFPCALLLLGTPHSAALHTSGPERKPEDLFESMKLQEEREYQILPAWEESKFKT